MKRLICILLIFNCFSCSKKEAGVQIDFSQYKIAEDLELELVAAEPVLNAPVAMQFDEKGRAWVLEMPGYMPNIHGEGEDKAVGRILILEDEDGDGYMEKHKVFLDELKQARAFCLVYGGILYAEPPFLYFAKVENDQITKKEIVDANYAVGGNIEHQANALTLNIDNWIYSAKAHKRYRRIDNEWLIEPTAFRGQWGLSKDDYGRLYCNDNSNALYADLTLPNSSSENPYLHQSKTTSFWAMKDRSVFPLQPTMVNRGYMDGMLDENGVLQKITSVCGPVILRSENLGPEFKGNGFIAVPEANAVKRVFINEDGGMIEAKNAYDGKEFIASTDEGFRPVNLYNGPDGNLYIVDMHRGIIQHKVYMTTYLKGLIEKHNLDTIYNQGRILRLKSSDTPQSNFTLDPLDGNGLIQALNDNNGWIRDKSQSFLIDLNDTSLISQLEDLAKSENEIPAIHALWTLEGMKALSGDLLSEVLQLKGTNRKAHAIKLSSRFPYSSRLINQLAKVDYSIPLLRWELASVSSKLKMDERIASNLLEAYPEDEILFEHLISGSDDVSFLLAIADKRSNEKFKSLVRQVMENKKEDNKHFTHKEANAFSKDDKTVGRDHFNIYCASCHGMGGEGKEQLAPSLLEAAIVDAGAEHVIKVILNGLQGPITIAGRKVDFPTVMPGIKHNEDITDEMIANMCSYISNAFSKTPTSVKTEMVTSIRKELEDNNEMFTEQYLLLSDN